VGVPGKNIQSTPLFSRTKTRKPRNPCRKAYFVRRPGIQLSDELTGSQSLWDLDPPDKKVCVKCTFLHSARALAGVWPCNSSAGQQPTSQLWTILTPTGFVAQSQLDQRGTALKEELPWILFSSNCVIPRV